MENQSHVVRHTDKPTHRHTDKQTLIFFNYDPFDIGLMKYKENHYHLIAVLFSLSNLIGNILDNC